MRPAECEAQSGPAADSTTVEPALQQVQDSVFGAPGDSSAGLSSPIDRLASALEAFANTPESTPLRVGVQTALAGLTVEKPHGTIP